CDERLAFLKSLKTWPVFGTGWGRRVADVRRDALAMATNVAGAADTTAIGKGSVPAPKAARTATASAIVVSGAGAAQAAHAWGASMSVMFAIVAVTAILTVASWIGWTVWHRRRQDVAGDAAMGG